jgi:hypothetical protein
MRKTLWIAAVLLAFPACGTQDISTPLTAIGTEPGPDRGKLRIVFSSSLDTYEASQSGALSPTAYGVFVDGSQLILDYFDGEPEPITVVESSSFDGGYLAAGAHHVAIAAAGGGAVIFAGDTHIPPGSTTTLYLFGHRDARQGRFVSYPEVPAPGTLHVSVMNLVRLGPGLEVLSCADATSCAPLSPPLAFGEIFDADFAAGTSDDTRFFLATGASIGYRQLATAALPAPPVQPLSSLYAPPESVRSQPANLVVAPLYMSAQGGVLGSF